MVFDKLKLKSKGKGIETSLSVDAGKAPTKKQIYQSRFNFGVNFGGCFVLEKWIYHSIFPENTGCELEVAQKLLKDKGADEAKSIFENHWKNYMNDDDWKWLHEHKVNSVRVPLGYWEIPGFTKGTKFDSCKSVYENAWSIFKTNFVEKAAQYDISVLVDLHGLPGGANGSDHSGEKGSGKAEFWSNPDDQLNVTKMFEWIAGDLSKYENISGIQVVNEAEFSDDIKKQGAFYKACISSIRKNDKSVPVVISDGWWPDQWAKFVIDLQSSGPVGVVIDHHCYRCFDDKDKSKSPQQIIDDLDKDLLTNITPGEGNAGADYMVGEYSCVLDGASWNVDDAGSKRDELVVDYGKKQSQLYAKRATVGSYFWTFKFESGNGGEWDLRTMMDKGAIEAPKFPGSRGSDEMENALSASYDEHVNYWNDNAKGEKMDHERFKDGFKRAWEDCNSFAEADSILGRVNAWKESRKQEHIAKKGDSKYLWEWEQGFDKGVQEFYS